MIVTDVAVRNFFFLALACKISLIFASFEHCTKISVLVLLIFVKSKRGFSSLPYFTFLPGCGNKEPSNFKSDHQISPTWNIFYLFRFTQPVKNYSSSPIPIVKFIDFIFVARLAGSTSRCWTT